MSDCPVSVGDLLAEKYRVEKVLGQGGMGVVVAAWHIELEQRVAVKFLLSQFAQDSGASERFRREARAAVKLRNEHVARVIDVGVMADGAPYMVMEHLDGNDLQTELERVGCFPVEEAVEYVLQACLAMAEAHAKGMVHRDLKPANLFKTSRADGSRLIKVLDFGISKSIQGTSDPQLSLTRTASMIGSPLYMSPEQLESARDVDQRADVWSLGVILFELLTGSVPFEGETLPQLVRSVLQGDFPPAHSVRTDVPAQLSAVIARCLARKKEERLANVGELADALAPFMTEGERYSHRVVRVLQLSGLPNATDPTIPVQIVRGGTGGQAAAPAPPTRVDGSPMAGGVGPGTSVGTSAGLSAAHVPASEQNASSTVHIDDPGGSGELEAPTGPSAPGQPTSHHKTVNSWGGTGPVGGASAPAMAKRGLGRWLAVAAVVMVAGGLIAWGGLAGDPTASSAASEFPETPSQPPSDTPVHPVAVAESPGVAEPEVEKSAAVVEPEATSAGSQAPVVEVTPAAPIASELSVAPKPTEAARAPSTVRPTKRPAAPPRRQPTTEKKGGSGFTDFGGRR
jgi:serine/threonine-protein kinase